MNTSGTAGLTQTLDTAQTTLESPQLQEKKETQTDTLIRLASELKLFLNQYNEAYAVIESSGKREIQKIGSKALDRWLMRQYFADFNSPPSPDAIKQTNRVLMMKAHEEELVYPLHLRIAHHQDSIYYDNGDVSGSVIKISNEGYRVEAQPPILFHRTLNVAPQSLPAAGGKLSDILQHVRIKDEWDELLFMIYLVTCFIPGIPHPALIFSGEKGAAKTTSTRIIRSLVDPAKQDTTFLPSGTGDLALSLSKNYMLCLDNLDSLTAEKSDLLCTAVTGGGISKRKLFTDDEEVILSFKRCIVLNGIHVVASRPDLLDRSILIELERIEEKDRKEESTIWADFEAAKPCILGAIYDLVGKAMKLYPSVQLPELFRMADFTRWGYAVAEAAGLDGNLFLEAYKANITRTNTEAIESNPVATAICVLMDKQPEWHSTVTGLLDALENVAFHERINTKARMWPKAAHILSRRLGEVKSNLEKRGITFDIKNEGPAKFITIEKKPAE
ncbi:hypothetical protein ACFOQM_06285 [Paenibacillus sp. GCM10012307]|uniref:ATP-binding protein n=1 Tax=Paenibacillus roseus TaxID=2798579 RepID=A0A934J5T7_9BACL|nr:hypothetical protein [Paenibacillus roseus]MBJ6360907.1 hypothetical protein [Paenibacillus roseus]